MIYTALMLALVTLVVYPELAIYLNWAAYKLIVWMRSKWPRK